MTASAADRVSIDALRDALRAIPGVEDVAVGDEAVWLVCVPGSDAPAVADRAAARLLECAPAGFQLPVRTVLRPTARREARLRFKRAERLERPEVRVLFRVTLQWADMEVVGEAVGEKGEVLELRTAALATIDAIERATRAPLDVRLAGIKRVRVFDAELMVVSLNRSGPGSQRLVGAVVIGNDLWRASALAVMHALNRVLGNVLATR